MTRLWGTCQFLFALLVALVALGGSTLVYKDTNKVLRELRNVSSSSSNVKQCLWFAMQEYNKDSKDKFLFQVVRVWQVQMQVRELPPTLHTCSCLPLVAQTKARMRERARELCWDSVVLDTVVLSPTASSLS